MRANRELLLRWLEGDLPPRERERLERRLEREPGLRSELQRLERLRDDLRSTGQERFAPYFAERVARSVGAGFLGEQRYAVLRWAFARAAVACLVLVVALSAYNAAGGDLASSLLESVLGLPAATLDAALLLGAA